MDPFIPMPFQLHEEHTAQYCSLLGTLNFFIPHEFAVKPDYRHVKSVECGDITGDLLPKPMVVLYRPCKTGPTETRSPFNVLNPETVTSQAFYTLKSS